MTPQELTSLSAPTRLDRAIAAVFPGWGAARLRARREFSYEAARSTRLRHSATRLQGPEDYTAFPDRLQLIREMRDLRQNFGLAQGIIDKLALYAFGRLRYQARTGDERTDQLYEDYLLGCFERADLSGRHDFQQLAAIGFKSHLSDGDFAHKWRRDAGQLRLQGIESDRIGGNCIVSADENVFQGITVDLETGQPITYDVYRRTKANAYVDRVAVPAQDILLLFDPGRIDQYRGITPFAPIIGEARDLKEVLEACLIGTKFENMHGAVGYTPTGAPLSNPDELIASTETNANGQTLQEQQLKPGMIQWAMSGSELAFIKSDRPSGTFQTYVDLLVRLECIALNLPYSFVYSMLGTGPAVRADLQQAHRTIEYHQSNWSKRIGYPSVRTWLMDGIAQGRIPYTRNWHKGKFFFAPAVSIDAGRDSAARVAERNAGLRSEDSIFSEDAEDAAEQKAIIAQEALETLKTAQKIAGETGIDLPIVLTLLGARTPNGYLFATPQYDGESASEIADAQIAQTEAKATAPAPASTDFSKREHIRALINAARQRPHQLAAAVDQRRAPSDVGAPLAGALARHREILRQLDEARRHWSRN
jgi:capsid protein